MELQIYTEYDNTSQHGLFVLQYYIWVQMISNVHIKAPTLKDSSSV